MGVICLVKRGAKPLVRPKESDDNLTSGTFCVCVGWASSPLFFTRCFSLTHFHLVRTHHILSMSTVSCKSQGTVLPCLAPPSRYLEPDHSFDM